ncbi:Rv3654c family TadE-like protein [Nocardioides limicola]|uniref:Rv3654c family TadE-like protein n=1 Tax=Nocardioides limicola TaxID=2803368 RepID=UPI0027DAE355|nr:Rv3654c family TadE-like protein [Nocardioides sp. DJM-14]
MRPPTRFRCPARCRGERGAATAAAVGLIGVLVTVALAAAWVGAVMAAHRGAQSGADLAALAGATAMVAGGDGCAEATRVAAVNQVTLVSCLADGMAVTVTVTVETPALAGREATLTATARAGPP